MFSVYDFDPIMPYFSKETLIRLAKSYSSTIQTKNKIEKIELKQENLNKDDRKYLEAVIDYGRNREVKKQRSEERNMAYE